MTGTALVTGTSSGIGTAVAEALIASGWRVIGLSRSRGSTPEGVEWVAADLADGAGTLAAVEQVGAMAPALDAIVHCAGLQGSGPLGALDHDAGARMWAVHVHAAELICDRLAGSLVDGGRIVLVGSRTMVGVPGKSQYAATKAALAAMARAWAAELAPRSVTVNVVAPGPTRTPMLADPARAATPPVVPALGRLVEPAEVAALVEFVLGPNGAMITGQTLVICGGASLGLPR